MNIKQLNEELDKILNEEGVVVGFFDLNIDVDSEIIDKYCTNELTIEEVLDIIRPELDQYSDEDISKMYFDYRDQSYENISMEEARNIPRIEKEKAMVDFALFSNYEDDEREPDYN